MSDIIDDIFKKNLVADDMPHNPAFDVDASWKRFYGKRKQARRILMYKSAAVFLPLLISAMVLLLIGLNKNEQVTSKLTDEERRAKLHEMEERMSGTYIPEYYCETCRRTTINYIELIEKEMDGSIIILQ